MSTLLPARRTLLRGFTALAGGAVLAGHRSFAEGLRNVTFITPYGSSVAYAPDYVAQAAGLFRRNGIEVHIVGGTGSSSAIQQVVAGQALIGRTGGIDVIHAVAAAKAPIRAIGTIAHTSVFVLVSAEAAPVQRPADLAGKTVGIVSAGGGTENYLDIMLAHAGVPKDAVKRQVVGHSPGAFDLVKLKRIDAFICDDSIVVNLRARRAPIAVMQIGPYASVPGQVYVASEQGIAEQYDALLAYLRAVRAAVRQIEADATGEATLRLLQPFNLPDMRQPELGWATIRAAETQWDARGADKHLAIIPEDWARGWQEMADAGLVRAGDPTRAYTIDFTRAL
jgi:ABC-type nitrate/sulfonate/bicarbonate transport system substrate-binding protein